MPKWVTVPKTWEGKDVFIIGGGTSLKGFNWSLLRGEATIGCNAAYLLGADVCKICIFGDTKFFTAYKAGLADYKGIVVTNSNDLQNSDVPWLWTLPRQGVGLHHNALGWNTNTGASAINLALLLGAKHIYLLGFDMKLSSDGKNNWHTKGLDKPNPNICKRMENAFKHVYRDWRKKFSSVGITNVTDSSALDGFPKIGVEKFWKERNGNETVTYISDKYLAVV